MVVWLMGRILSTVLVETHMQQQAIALAMIAISMAVSKLAKAIKMLHSSKAATAFNMHYSSASNANVTSGELQSIHMTL